MNELITICGIGTAGILNRCSKLLLVDDNNEVIATHKPDINHELYHKFEDARKYYWDIYQEKVKIPVGMRMNKYVI